MQELWICKGTFDFGGWKHNKRIGVGIEQSNSIKQKTVHGYEGDRIKEAVNGVNMFNDKLNAI